MATRDHWGAGRSTCALDAVPQRRPAWATSCSSSPPSSPVIGWEFGASRRAQREHRDHRRTRLRLLRRLFSARRGLPLRRDDGRGIPAAPPADHLEDRGRAGISVAINSNFALVGALYDGHACHGPLHRIGLRVRRERPVEPRRAPQALPLRRRTGHPVLGASAVLGRHPGHSGGGREPLADALGSKPTASCTCST